MNHFAEPVFSWSGSRPLVVAGHAVEDSRALYSLEFVRRGRGWLYRRFWWDARPSRWLKTSEAGRRYLLARFDAHCHHI